MNQVENNVFLKQHIEELSLLVTALKKANNIFEKLEVLNAWPVVQEYLSKPSVLNTFLAGVNPECDYIIKSIIAIKQAPIVLNMEQAGADKFDRLRHLIQQLQEVDHFYQYIGGIVGYHLTLLTMILNKDHSFCLNNYHSRYIHPEGFHLEQDKEEVNLAIRAGLEQFEKLAEIYPVGGAGDRLNLIDELSGAALPAALLNFTGKSLLEGLIRDLQAREYLYFKLYHKQVCTPIAMMTSQEKNNHDHILAICSRKNWFGRPSKSIFFFIQPLVPVITTEGNWSLSSYLTLVLKPGGHGVLWKLAKDKGVFNWLEEQGRDKSLIRQINNPIAGLDHTLLALFGIGIKHQKSFGFASCERLLNAAEGTNVLIETKIDHHFSYCLTNIEYTDFNQKGIGETPSKPGSPFSIFPTNTNILFADLTVIENTIQEGLIPGQLINMKSKVPYIDSEGHQSLVQGGRLESTMQNIADYLTTEFSYQLPSSDYIDSLQTFITYNQRVKTISTTKQTYKPENTSLDTPEQAYYDLLTNHRDLFTHYCDFDVPPLNSLEEYLLKGPNFIILYHPALGPLYSIIAQKIRQGKLGQNAELQIELAEVDIENLEIEGSALIESSHAIGYYDETGLLKYGRESRCSFHNVKIRNKGFNRQHSLCFWKNQISRDESFYLLLNEGAEFQAENVIFEGNFFFEIPAYHCLTVTQDNQGQLIKDLRKIEKPTWYWEYSFDLNDQIKLKKITSSHQLLF